ncbi:MAG: DUF3343 domain-containing protein [Desulfovibrionaceae bacterium]|nr:DUF3343 domain-containing protein [Desulfovibrionaceae bacterium]
MVFGKLFKKRPAKRPGGDKADRGLLVFENTSEVIRAEKMLTAEGWHIKVMGPPPEIQRGCDLVLEFPLIEELNIRRSLEDAGTAPLEVVPVTGPLLSPVDLFQVKDFGEHLMVRAANMKITVEKSTRTIVNISGGGCPDVPYIAARLIGHTLDDAPRPRDIGHTLCGYALNLAFDKAVEQCSP